MQNLFLKAMQEPNIVVTVVGQDIPNLKKGAVRDAYKIYYSSPLLKQAVNDYNKTDRIFNFKNGSIIEFNSYTDEQDAKSGKRDYAFFNEADGIPWEIYFQVSIRTFKQIYIDYNPTCGFWVQDKILNQPDVALFISDYRDNPFLDEITRKEIEAIGDAELWKVYARGKTGNLKGTIYPDWVPIDTWPDDIEEVIWGVDYGYTSDPTAIVKVGIKRPRTLYFEEISYQPGISEYQIKEIMEAAGWINGQPFYSEHDAEMVGALRRLGVYVLMARKGEGSVKPGILKMKQFKCYYTKRSMNLHKERLRYKWAYVGETPTNTPDKSPDHCLDAARYACYTHFYGE